MEKTCFPFILLIFLLESILACKKESISYNDAMAKGHARDTTISVGTGNMTYFKTFPLKTIIGAQLPSFEVKSMDGKTINEDYFKGKISVINFWFIGCHPCEAEMPGFNAMVEKYRNQHVQFLGISRNSPEDISKFILTHPFLIDQIAYGEPLTKETFKFKWGYPVTMVADQNLKIIYAKEGGKADSSAIDEIQKDLIPVIDGALKKM